MKRIFVPIALVLAGGLFSGFASAATTTYAATKYPIVLVHGWLGFSQFGGAVDYFYQVPATLSANGATVFAPAVSPVNSNEVRGEELLSSVRTILAVTGAQKVNLIGHSQGAPTARYVAGVIPSSVASVTSISGANKGGPLSDVFLAVANNQILGGLASSVVGGIMNALGSAIGSISGQSFPISTTAAMTSLSTAGAQAFNKKFPNGVPATACGSGVASANGQLYYSWTGSSAGITNMFDPLDYALTIFASAFAIAPAPNDTLVSTCSAHFGTVLRDNYPWNHLDAVNQTLGLLGAGVPNPVQVILDHANRLKQAGV